MSGERTGGSGGEAASVAAGCTLRENSAAAYGIASLPDSSGHDGDNSVSETTSSYISPRASYSNRYNPNSYTTTTAAGSNSMQIDTYQDSYNHNDGLAVFSWGRGEDGQLGLGDTSDQDEPTYVDALRGVGVRQIACGSGHTVVLTTDGEVYTWGRGDDGRLGHGDNGWKYVPRITQSLAGQVVVQVTCGSYHTAAVTGNGDLYTWGGGMYGKLGHGNESGHSTPKRVEGLVGLVVSHIACGSRHTAVITSTGALYTWGDKENGVAGHGDTDGHQYTPKLLEKLAGKRIVQLSACGFHTGCLTDNHECYTWGEGKFGRLGHNAERNCHSPRLVESLLGKRPKQIACGGFHTAVITEKGQMYTFGGGEHGQLGHGDRVNRVKPTLVQALDGIHISQITCGWSHSVALATSPTKGIYTWGNGDHGKLGHGSGRKVSIPHLVEKLKDYRVVKVASYNEHTAALVEPFDHYVPLSGISSSGSNTHQNDGLRSHGFSRLRGGVGNAVPVTTSYCQQMRLLVNDEEFADVTFMVGNDDNRNSDSNTGCGSSGDDNNNNDSKTSGSLSPIYAHRAILAQRCDHFAAMFRSGMRESVERTITIPNISKKVFLLLLEYIYTDSVKVELEYAVDLYIASDLYQLDRLRDICCTVVRRNLNAENSAQLLQASSESHCQVLKEVCMAYIVDNFDIVSKTEGIKHVSHPLLLEILAMRP